MGTFEDGTIAFLCTQRAVIGSWWMCARLTLHVDDLEERLTRSPLHLRDLAPVSAQQASLFFFSLSQMIKDLLEPRRAAAPSACSAGKLFLLRCSLSFGGFKYSRLVGFWSLWTKGTRRFCLPACVPWIVPLKTYALPQRRLLRFVLLRVSITIREMRIKSGSNRHRTKLL